YRGLGRTINKFSITPRGEVRVAEGDSQLPYLIGNLSMLIFEPLPETDKNSWTVSGASSVYEEEDNPRFGHPMFRNRGPVKTTKADESTSFTLLETKGDLATYQKTYSLNVPGDDETTTINSKGRWTFNQTLGLPESLDLEHRMNIKEENVTIEIPVKIKYHRLSSEEFADFERKQKEEQERRKLEHEQRMAELKKPLGDTERQDLATKLQGGSMHELMSPLIQLSHRGEVNDAEIAKAIRPLLNHPEFMVRNMAAEALKNVSPEFRRIHSIYEDYSRPMPLDNMGPPVTDKTKLAPGMFVANQEHSRWYPKRVTRVLADGRVEVQDAHGHRTETFARSDLRQAPAELNQFLSGTPAPAAAPSNSAAPSRRTTPRSNSYATQMRNRTAQPAAPAPTAPPMNNADDEYRTWTDDTGSFAVVAQFVSSDQKNVQLRRKNNGKIFTVPLDRLSKVDRQWLQQHQQKPQGDNPFEPASNPFE
ncbi:MAG: hypothetical protein JW818_20865, partial [Pirellulales bacterium]|nr:hypothetical protein [Pirellulales bacterium]